MRRGDAILHEEQVTKYLGSINLVTNLETLPSRIFSQIQLWDSIAWPRYRQRMCHKIRTWHMPVSVSKMYANTTSCLASVCYSCERYLHQVLLSHVYKTVDITHFQTLSCLWPLDPSGLKLQPTISLTKNTKWLPSITHFRTMTKRIEMNQEQISFLFCTA